VKGDRLALHKVITLLSLTTILVGGAISDLLAQETPSCPTGRRITAVEVEVERGDYRTSDEKAFLERARAVRATVFANIKTQANKVFSETLLNDDLRRLTALGQFHADVRLQESEAGVRIIFVISPKFRIKEITLKLEDGSTPSGAEELSNSVTSSVGEYFSKYFADYDAETLAAAYAEKGYPFARARYATETEKDSLKLTFIIDPGLYIRIEYVLFEGNKFFSAKELYSKIQTRRYTFLRNIFGDPTYNAKRLEQDIQTVRNAYRDQGFLDAKAFLKEVTFDFRENMATPVIEVIEGARYTISSITLSGATLFPQEQIIGKLSLKKEEPLLLENVRKDVQAIRDLYGSSAYIFTTVEPILEFDEAGSQAHIKYQVNESAKTYVEKILIRGNDRTKEKVIRRELSIYPGDEFNISEIQSSRDRLINLQYFSSIDIEAAPGTAPDKRDLIVSVQERKTGQLRLGFSVSSTLGFQGLFALTQPNFDLFDPPKSLEDFASGNAFAGAGTYLSLELMPGRETSRYRILYRDPHIFDSDYRFSLGLGYSDTTYNRWREQKEYVSLGLGRNLTRNLTLDVLYRIQDTVLSNFSPYAPLDAFEWEGASTLSALRSVLSYNRAQSDNFGTRYKGYNLQWSYEYAGGFLGADIDFSSTSLSAWLYKRVLETRAGHKHVLSLEASGAWMEPHHNTRDIPIYERLFAGGPGTIRGFEWRGIGPHEYSNAIGGTVRAYANLEYSLPLPIQEESFRGLLFVDTANLASDFDSFRFNEFRASAGFGFRIKALPFFVIALDFGYPLRWEHGIDERRTFHFTIGGEW
jgi:outer membrane protein insertion porin family